MTFCKAKNHLHHCTKSYLPQATIQNIRTWQVITPRRRQSLIWPKQVCPPEQGITTYDIYFNDDRRGGGGGNRERDEGGLFTLAKQDAVNTSNAFSNNQKMELILHKELECAAQPHDVGGHTAKDKHKFKLPAHE